MSDFIVYKDNTGKPLVDTLVDGTGRAIVLSSGASVTFSMRNADSSVLKVNSEPVEIVTPAQAKVKYNWNSSDIDTAGEYYGWFTVNDNGVSWDTPESLVIVAEHRPGLRVKTGAIYQAAKSFLPITWERLEESKHYGDAQLQQKVDIAKLSLLGTEISVEDEDNLDIRVQAYIAKIAVVSVIPAGKDYWAAMSVTKSIKGPDESVSYPDRIEMLEQLHDQLVQEIAADRDDIAELIDTPQIRRPNSVPSVSDGTDEGFITPNPHANFRDYGFSVRGNNPLRRNAVSNERRFWI
jgi:hypothetical protein